MRTNYPRRNVILLCKTINCFVKWYEFKRFFSVPNVYAVDMVVCVRGGNLFRTQSRIYTNNKGRRRVLVERIAYNVFLFPDSGTARRMDEKWEIMCPV